jgi:hypothetical protein
MLSFCSSISVVGGGGIVLWLCIPALLLEFGPLFCFLPGPTRLGSRLDLS